MFLSCLHLNVSMPSVRQCLKDCQDMHRTIMKAFPDLVDSPSRETCGVLYRIMHSQVAIKVYVLSGIYPQWQTIANLGFECRGVKDISVLPSAFIDGRRLAFDALLSPTKKAARLQGNSRRVFLASAAERAEWLARKAQQNGFTIEWMREEGQIVQTGTHGTSKGDTMHHVGVRFKGVLVVTNKAAFCRAFAKGIGAGKAYGFGLLMLS